jgi:phenylacetate-coenzyme A ligase PaaK-like adenylate-forming protein
MTGGHGGPAEQELALRARFGAELVRHSSFHRGRLERAGLDEHGIRHLSELQRLPPMELDDLESSFQLTATGMSENGLRQRRRYWPLQWVAAARHWLAYSADDLAQLGDLGRDMFEAAGVDSTDVVANVLPSAGSVDFWQVTLGAQAAGLSSFACGPHVSARELDVLHPTVLVGRAGELVRLLDESSEREPPYIERLHTLILTGDAPSNTQWTSLVDAMGGDEHAIVRAWAPPGVLAMWSQCRGGTGLHTWSGFELIEVVDPVSGLPAVDSAAGQVVWTGLGWYASSVLRLRTDALASVEHGICPTCGRSSSRIVVTDDAPGFPDVLDSHPDIAAWYAELHRADTGDELVLRVALRDMLASMHVLQYIDVRIGPAQVMVVDVAEVERRIEEANGERVGDRRAVPAFG